MQNVAYICADNAPSNPTGPGGAIVCGNTNPPPPPPIGQCDPLNPNSQKDPACIKVTPPIPASCDSLTVNPSTGVVPLNVAVSCSATSAVKYLIDCGNSTSITTPTGTCRYPVVGTYTAKCTINDTISSVACTKIVTPSAAPVFSEVVIKKYAKEITAL